LLFRVFNSELQYFTGAIYSGIASVSINTWYRVELKIFSSSKIELYINEVFKGEVDEGLDDSFSYLRFGDYKNWAPSDVYYDNYFIGKLVDPESAHGSWGSEETSALPSNRIYVLDKENNLFKIDPLDLSEENTLGLS